MKRTGRWQDWAILILGAWLFVSPFILGYAPLAAAAWNAYVVGAAVAILAASALWVPSFGLDEEWGNLALGLWLVAAPFLLGFYSADSLAAWNQIVVGILVAGDAAWAVAVRPLESRTPQA
jgi:hypothetical protein